MKRKPKPRAEQETPLAVPMPFDEAMRLAIQVAPPKEGWPAYFEKLNPKPKRRSPRRK